jgi:hypothetical protein
MLLSAIDMSGASSNKTQPNTGADLKLHLIGIDVAALVAHRTAEQQRGAPVNGWRDTCAAA